MRLDVTPHGMKIVTETVQDVAYLKHMGYLSEDDNMCLKVWVERIFKKIPGANSVESAEISIQWEDERCHSCNSLSSDEVREYVQSAMSHNVPQKAEPEILTPAEVP